jgi:hypothetical protein
MIDQKLCLNNGKFQFKEIELDREIMIEGNYVVSGDTLILNKDVKSKKHHFSGELYFLIDSEKLWYLTNDKKSSLFFEIGNVYSVKSK